MRKAFVLVLVVIFAAVLFAACSPAPAGVKPTQPWLPPTWGEATPLPPGWSCSGGWCCVGCGRQCPPDGGAHCDPGGDDTGPRAGRRITAPWQVWR